MKHMPHKLTDKEMREIGRGVSDAQKVKRRATTVAVNAFANLQLH